MANLSEKLKSGIVVDKDMVVVCYDFDGNIDKVQKIEYMSNKVYQTFLLDQKNNKEKEQVLLADKQKNELKEHLEKEKQQFKRDVLTAFDRWYRDVTNGLVEFDNEVYESVISWYRDFLQDDTIEINEELSKYL